jgi:hypothetical protein
LTPKNRKGFDFKNVFNKKNCNFVIKIPIFDVTKIGGEKTNLIGVVHYQLLYFVAQ